MLRPLSFFVTNILIILVLALILPGFEINSVFAATVFIFLLTLFNWTVVPILKILALPISILTFGLFNGLINLIVIGFVASILEGVNIQGGLLEFLLISFIISVCLSLGHSVADRLTSHKDS